MPEGSDLQLAGNYTGQTFNLAADTFNPGAGPDITVTPCRARALGVCRGLYWTLPAMKGLGGQSTTGMDMRKISFISHKTSQNFRMPPMKLKHRVDHEKGKRHRPRPNSLVTTSRRNRILPIYPWALARLQSKGHYCRTLALRP